MEIRKEILNCLLDETMKTMSTRVGGAKSLKWL